MQSKIDEKIRKLREKEKMAEEHYNNLDKRQKEENKKDIALQPLGLKGSHDSDSSSKSVEEAWEEYMRAKKERENTEEEKCRLGLG